MNLKPDLEITVAAAAAITERARLTGTVTGLRPLAGGQISAVYEIGLSPPAASVILKIYPDSFEWKMGKEANLYRAFQSTTLPVPRLLLVDDSKTLIPLNFIVVTKLDGDLLLPLEPTLSEPTLSTLYAEMGQVLRDFHRMQMSAFGYVVANGVKDPHADNASYMRFQFAKKLDEFRGHGGNQDAARLLAQYVEVSAHLLERCSSAVLCHNDFHAGNVLVSRADDRDFRLTGVVDFENVIAGDPLMDLAKTELYAVGDSKLKREALYGGYGPIARTDAVPTIDLYRAYHAIELWDWLATTGDLTGNLAKIANAEIEKVIQRSSAG